MGLLASPLTVESQCLFNLCPFVSLLTLNFSSSFRTFKIYCSDYNGRIRIQTVYKAHVNEQFGKLVDQLTSIFPLYEQLLYVILLFTSHALRYNFLAFSNSSVSNVSRQAFSFFFIP